MNCRGLFIEASSEIGRKLNICKPSKERVKTCKDYAVNCDDPHFHLQPAVQIWIYFIYTLHHFTPHGKIRTKLIDIAPNVWLHSSVGGASHRFRGGHGFEAS